MDIVLLIFGMLLNLIGVICFVGMFYQKRLLFVFAWMILVISLFACGHFSIRLGLDLIEDTNDVRPLFMDMMRLALGR